MLSIASILAKRLPVAAEELASDGFPALIDAVERFDPSFGASFQTFAGTRIRGQILDAVRDRDRDVGRQARHRQRVQDDAIATFAAEHGRQPSEAERDHLLPSMTPLVRQTWREHVRRATPGSLDLPIVLPDGRVTSAAANIVARGASHTATVDDCNEIDAMLVGLPDRIAATIRIMVDDPSRDWTNADVAAIRGLSASAVQQHLFIARAHFEAWRAGHRFSVPPPVAETPPTVVRLPDVHVRPVTVRAGESREPIVGMAQIARLWPRRRVVVPKVTIREREVWPAPVIKVKPTVRRQRFEAVPSELIALLSARERQVVELRASGLTSQQVAQHIGRGLANVSALSRLARRRIRAANAAREAGQSIDRFASRRRELPPSRHPIVKLLISFRPRQLHQRAEVVAEESFPHLTKRQREIATLRAAGLSHKAIGERLGITASTAIVTLKDARKRLKRIAEGATHA